MDLRVADGADGDDHHVEGIEQVPSVDHHVAGDAVQDDHAEQDDRQAKTQQGVAQPSLLHPSALRLFFKLIHGDSLLAWPGRPGFARSRFCLQVSQPSCASDSRLSPIDIPEWEQRLRRSRTRDEGKPSGYSRIRLSAAARTFQAW